ncbi:hypothetical protein AB0D66_28725 [Streptomyces sp. NPDC048270]|uniref:hypothetical protein n=1 Tax=Streptomyces sp. NPDC048270 TaxID=3154615 RepID=UPI0033FA3852
MFEPLEPGGGVLPDWGRWRNAANLLLCTAGAVGVALGGWALSDTYRTHQDREASRTLITRACAGLVDAGTVMELDGGADRVVLGGEGPDPGTVGLDALPGRCVLHRLEDRDGRDLRLSQFTLTLQALPRERALHTVGDSRQEPFSTLRLGSRDEVTARTRTPGRPPLGDGRLGDYGPADVTVVARCEQPALDGMTSLVVTAAAPGTRQEAGDRPRLARLARQAAERAAAEFGCRTRLPGLPERLPAPVAELGPVGERSDSCAWYAAHVRTADSGRLPDRAAGVPLTGGAREESCLLAVGREATERVFPTLSPDERARLDLNGILWTSPWWVRTRTYYGEDAAAVAVEVRGTHSPDPLVPGRAGRLGDVLHGSMTCDGRPATLTMTVPYRYRSVLGPRLDELFKAYATDAATRRGCTGPVLPAAQ